MASECLFCGIVAGDVPAQIVPWIPRGADEQQIAAIAGSSIEAVRGDHCAD